MSNHGLNPAPGLTALHRGEVQENQGVVRDSKTGGAAPLSSPASEASRGRIGAAAGAARMGGPATAGGRPGVDRLRLTVLLPLGAMLLLGGCVGQPSAYPPRLAAASSYPRAVPRPALRPVTPTAAQRREPGPEERERLFRQFDTWRAANGETP